MYGLGDGRLCCRQQRFGRQPWNEREAQARYVKMGIRCKAPEYRRFLAFCTRAQKSQETILPFVRSVILTQLHIHDGLLRI